MDDWIDMYNEVVCFIKNEKKKQSIQLNKNLRYSQINLINLDRTKLKKDFKPFKNNLVKKTGIDFHILDYCVNDVLAMFKSSITNLRNANIKKRLVKMDKIKSLKRKQVKHKRKYLLEYERKLSNCVNNLHWQVVNYLTTNYNHILLGNYSTKEMVENEKSNKMNKRIGSSLKFYQFIQKLIYKCISKSCKFSLIDEFNTTKACSNCSTLNNIGKSRVYNCKRCLQSYNRDTNSSKNILLRAIQ